MARPRSSAPKLTARDREFLAQYDASVFARPSLTVDVVLLTLREGALTTLLVRRSVAPFQGAHALPGSFVGSHEGLDEAAARVLAHECGLRNVFLEQLHAFGRIDRDPRTRVVSIAYYALVEAEKLERALAARAGRAPESDRPAEELALARLRAGERRGDGTLPLTLTAPTGQALRLAFDHEEIVAMAVARLRDKLDDAPVGYQLLPERFTLLELMRVHETVLGRSLNKDSFRRRMLASGELVALGEHQSDVGHRPAELFRFARRSAL